MEEFEQDRCELFSKNMIETTCEAIWPWAFGRLLITVFISVLVIDWFSFSISFLFSLGKLDLSKNLSISSWLSILLTYICFLVSYASLFFCGVSCNIFLFISNFIYLRHLPFFLLSLAKGLSILFFQRTSS